MPRTYVKKTDRVYKNHKPKALRTYRPSAILKLDQRTALAKVCRQRFESLANDLGGLDSLSGMQVLLLDKLVFLEARLAAHQSAVFGAKSPKEAAEIEGRWVQQLNTLVGLAKTLGIERKVRDTPWIAAPANGTIRNGHAVPAED